MLKNIGIVMVAMGFIVLIMMVGELFLVHMDVQGAFDRSTRIAADQTRDQNSPDLPINEAVAADIFLDVLQKNLNLDPSNSAMNNAQRLQKVSIDAFSVANVTSKTVFTATSPVTGETVTGFVSQPSVIVLGVATVHLSFWPTDIPMTILSVSGGARPL